MSQLPASAGKVQKAADALGLAVAIREMPASTRTAAEAAAACGVAVGQIVKSLVFVGGESGQPCLILVSGSNRVNERAAGERIGETLKRPDADHVRRLTGFVIGGIPPLGHDTRLATYMDEDLLRYNIVWAAAGTPRAVFSVAPQQLRDAIGATVISVI